MYAIYMSPNELNFKKNSIWLWITKNDSFNILFQEPANFWILSLFPFIWNVKIVAPRHLNFLIWDTTTGIMKSCKKIVFCGLLQNFFLSNVWEVRSWSLNGAKLFFSGFQTHVIPCLKKRKKRKEILMERIRKLLGNDSLSEETNIEK